MRSSLFLLVPLGIALASAGRSLASSADDGLHLAILQPEWSADLAPDGEGVLAEVLVTRGDFVEEGQVLARLESGVELAEVELARVRAETAAPVEAARLEVELRSAELERARSLRNEGFETLQQLEEAEFNVARAEVGLESARLEQEVARRELVRAQARVARREIRAPRAGVVIDRSAQLGQLVNRGAGESLFRVASLDRLIADVRLPGSRFSSVSIGDSAEVGAIDRPLAVPARVVNVDPTIDASSDTFRVRVLLDLDPFEGESPIPAGSRVRVRLNHTR